MLMDVQTDVHEKIIDMILNEQWRETIEVLTEDMDPWDIDLVVLSERFISYLEKLKSRDLKVPAKMVLIAALIYRMKSEFFKPPSYEEDIPKEEDVYIDEEMIENLNDINLGNLDINVVNLPTIILPTKKPVARKVTIYELLDALEKALRSRRRHINDEMFSFDLHEFDIRELIEETYEKIIELFRVEKDVVFSHLLDRDDALEKIMRFQSILHLSNEERIICKQDEPFGEIFIHPLMSGDKDV